jgi:hypothetical protein
MAICESLIKQAITVDCDNPMVKGLEPDGVIINRADIDFASCTVTKNIISALVLKTGKVGFQCVQMGATPFTGTKVTLNVGTYRNTFTNEVVLAVLDNGPTVSEKIIDGLANGQFVAVLRNKHKGEDGKAEFQVFGYYQGLKASAIEEDKYSEDLDGGWLVTLQEEGAPKSAMFMYSTSSAATEAAYESLYTPST